MALALPRIRNNHWELENALRWLADIVVLADLSHDTDVVTGVCRDPADEAEHRMPTRVRITWEYD